MYARQKKKKKRTLILSNSCSLGAWRQKLAMSDDELVGFNGLPGLATNSPRKHSKAMDFLCTQIQQYIHTPKHIHLYVCVCKCIEICMFIRVMGMLCYAAIMRCAKVPIEGPWCLLEALEAWWGGTLSWWLLCRSSGLFRFNGESFGESGSRLIAGCQSVSSVSKVGWKNLWDSRKVCGQSVVLALRKSAVGTHSIQQVCRRNCTGSSITIPWGVDGWAHKLRPNFHPKPNSTLTWGNLIN